MAIHSKRFGFEIEVTAKIAKIRCKIYEVPISYYGRTYEEGKKISTRDGIHALYCIFYYNLLTSRIRQLAVQMDNFAQEFVAELQRTFVRE